MLGNCVCNYGLGVLGIKSGVLLLGRTLWLMEILEAVRICIMVEEPSVFLDSGVMGPVHFLDLALGFWGLVEAVGLRVLASTVHGIGSLGWLGPRSIYGTSEEKPEVAKPMPVTRMSLKARFCRLGYFLSLGC